MELIIKINLDNAAFKDDPEELQQILQWLAEGVIYDEYKSACNRSLQDSNGNQIGTVEITE